MNNLFIDNIAFRSSPQGQLLHMFRYAKMLCADGDDIGVQVQSTLEETKSKNWFKSGAEFDHNRASAKALEFIVRNGGDANDSNWRISIMLMGSTLAHWRKWIPVKPQTLTLIQEKMYTHMNRSTRIVFDCALERLQRCVIDIEERLANFSEKQKGTIPYHFNALFKDALPPVYVPLLMAAVTKIVRAGKLPSGHVFYGILECGFLIEVTAYGVSDATLLPIDIEHFTSPVTRHRAQPIQKVLLSRNTCTSPFKSIWGDEVELQNLTE